MVSPFRQRADVPRRCRAPYFIDPPNVETIAMIPRPDLPQTSRPRLYLACLASLLLACPFSSSNAQNIGFDPWFDESYGATEETSEPSGPSLPLAKGPRALYRAAMKAYQQIPEGQISKRIAALEEAITFHPEGSEEARSLLEELKARQAAAFAALQEVSRKPEPLLDSLALLQPHAVLFQGDSRLLFALLESEFSEALDRRIRQLGKEQRFDALAELGEATRRSGLSSSLGQRFSRQYEGALGSIIASKWEAAVASGSPLLPGETYLMGRLLQEPARKLVLQLQFAPDVSELLARNVTRSFERRWGKDFAIVTDEGVAADLVLRIDTDGVRTVWQAKRAKVPSAIAGHVQEEPNPEFLEKVQEYEKAAERYEIAMRVYEANYDRYIEQSYDREYENVQRDLQQADHAYQSVLRASGGMPSAELDAAKSARDTAQALANSVTHQSMPEPLKPRQTHLQILQELYLIPSTIVTSQESQAYEYTREELDYRFAAEANLALAAPRVAIATATAPVRLEQDRQWIRNEGVHPRDLEADAGDFSPDALQAASSLFALEFGSHCSRAFGALLDQARQSLGQPTSEAGDLAEVVLALALDWQQSSGSRSGLSQGAIDQLAELAQSGALVPAAFRARCLALAAQGSSAAHSLSADFFETRLR